MKAHSAEKWSPSEVNRRMDTGKFYIIGMFSVACIVFGLMFIAISPYFAILAIPPIIYWARFLTKTLTHEERQLDSVGRRIMTEYRALSPESQAYLQLDADTIKRLSYYEQNDVRSAIYDLKSAERKNKEAVDRLSSRGAELVQVIESRIEEVLEHTDQVEKIIESQKELEA